MAADPFPRTEIVQYLAEQFADAANDDDDAMAARYNERSREVMDKIITMMHQRWTQAGYALVPVEQVGGESTGTDG